MACWSLDPAARPRSAAACRAVVELLAGGPQPWLGVSAQAARVAGVSLAFSSRLVAAGCRAGELSWTGGPAHEGRLVHLGRVAGAGVPRRTAPPRPRPSLPDPAEIELLLALAALYARPRLAVLYAIAQGDAAAGPQ